MSRVRDPSPAPTPRFVLSTTRSLMQLRSAKAAVALRDLSDWPVPHRASGGRSPLAHQRMPAHRRVSSASTDTRSRSWRPAMNKQVVPWFRHEPSPTGSAHRHPRLRVRPRRMWFHPDDVARAWPRSPVDVVSGIPADPIARGVAGPCDSTVSRCGSVAVKRSRAAFVNAAQGVGARCRCRDGAGP